METGESSPSDAMAKVGCVGRVGGRGVDYVVAMGSSSCTWWALLTISGNN